MDETLTRDAIAEIDAIVAHLKRPEVFLKLWGKSVVKKARANAMSHSRDGKFWPSIANAVNLQNVSNNQVTVGITGADLHNKGVHKHFGGIIRAKNKKALTIPITAEAKGKNAEELNIDGHNLFMLKKSKQGYTLGFLGYNDTAGNFHALFVLRKQVTQKPEPWWPETDEVWGAAQDAVNQVYEVKSV